MILSAGLRTDIPAYYSEWFFNRLKEGYVYSRNPLFQNCVTEYTLSPDKVDAFYFCSKNYAPMLPRLGELKDYRTIFHATLNAYGTDLEPNLPPRQDRIDTILSLSKLVGRQRVYWRYDPILVTKEYSTDFHLEAFAELASILAPHVSGCVINFIEITREIERRLPERLTCTRTDRRTLLMGLGSIGKRLGLPIRICGRGEDFSAYGISRGGCSRRCAISAIGGGATASIAATSAPTIPARRAVSTVTPPSTPTKLNSSALCTTRTAPSSSERSPRRTA